MTHPNLNNGIPVSISLDQALEAEKPTSLRKSDKQRILIVSALSICIAVVVSVIAKLLVYLIDLITNIAFQGNFSFSHSSPANNTLGPWVIIIPVIGGLIIGLMARYGSKAIRGHGIPEAMEQILTNQSKIKPAITYLKPLSAAISIGTGGPFGAEGPIIATGGALGSTIGQLLKISHNERKIFLAAGATAGMSAIFGSPIAAVFLAIELLLFEFSPRSLIPVSLACITGAAGHLFLFEQGPVFPMDAVLAAPSVLALVVYVLMGSMLGVLSIFITKIVYFVEDSFDHLPVHWMWWPAIGGLIVGVIGYFSPRTLGVGYSNIIDVISGNLPLQVVVSLCVLKFVSWAFALGSGTSGGTLAPLLTIGGATGVLLGGVILNFFPECGITIPLAALVGMSAMFAGASRALLTSIIFALETTGQPKALLPLLGACATSYFISFLFMENTIMTEKIARRGVRTPHSYEPNLFEKITVERVISENGFVLSDEITIREAKEWLGKSPDEQSNYYIISNDKGEYKGILSSSNLFSHHHNNTDKVGSLVKRKAISITKDDVLRRAMEIMTSENVDVLPVVSTESNNIVGVLSFRDILSVYRSDVNEHIEQEPNISLKHRSLKVLIRGQKLFSLR